MSRSADFISWEISQWRRAELADRLRRAELAALELRFPGYPHPSLLAALQLSLDYLESSARQRYRELAVFAGRGAVPRSAVEALWAPAGLSVTDAAALVLRPDPRGAAAPLRAAPRRPGPAHRGPRRGHP